MTEEIVEKVATRSSPCRIPDVIYKCSPFKETGQKLLLMKDGCHIVNFFCRVYHVSKKGP